MNITALVAQFPVTLSISHNRHAIASILEQTNLDDLVVLPEGAVSGYSTDPSFLEQIGQTALQASLQYLQHQTQERKVHIWAGVCIKHAGRWFNAAYGFSGDGRVQIYYKINLEQIPI